MVIFDGVRKLHLHPKKQHLEINEHSHLNLLGKFMVNEMRIEKCVQNEVLG